MISYNTTTKKVTVTATATARTLHDDIQTTFAGSTYMQYLIPDSGKIKDILYQFENGWAFYDSTSIGYMTTGAWKDASGDNLLANIKAASGDSYTGVQLYYTQGSSPVNFGATGLVNCLLSVRASGTDVNSKTVTLYSRPAGKIYTSSTNSAGADGLIDSFNISAATDQSVTISDGTLAGYSDLSITWGTVSKDVGDGAGAQNYGISIVTTNASRTLKEIYNWVQYQLRSASDIDAGAGTHIGKITALLLDMAGSTMTTKQGVWVEGFASTDNNNIIYTDSAGATHSAPLTVPVTVSFDAAIAGGTGEVAVFVLDAPGYTDATYTPAHISSTLINGAASGTSAATSITYSADVPVRVLVRKSGYQQFSLYTTITSAGLNVSAQNPVDGTY